MPDSIGIHDLLKALAILKPDSDASANAIASVLGFELQVSTQFNSGHRKMEPSKLNDFHQPQQADREAVSIQHDGESGESIRHSKVVSQLSTIGNTGEDLIGSTLDNWFEPVWKKQSLFQIASFAEIALSMLSTWQVGNSVDPWKFINRLVAGDLLEELPHEYKHSICLGADLALDYSESMEPFFDDLDDLVERMIGALGGSKVRPFPYQVNKWATEGESLVWLTSAPKVLALNRPLLLVTDFGLRSSNPARMEIAPSLLSLIRNRRVLGGPSIALLPVTEDEIDQHISRNFELCVIWDRTASPSRIWARRSHDSIPREQSRNA